MMSRNKSLKCGVRSQVIIDEWIYNGVHNDLPMRIAAKVHLGPNRSQAAPAVNRTIEVAVKATMFEFPIWS